MCLFLTLWAQLWQPRLLCSSTTPAISFFSQYALFCLKIECKRQLIFSSLDMLGDLPSISFTVFLQMWISGLCTEDLSQMTDCTSCEFPTKKPLCWLAVSSEMELWSSRPVLLLLCWNMSVCLCNSCVLYHSQQAVIFPNREIIALQAAKGIQVCQAWMGWACPALWYSICSVFLAWLVCVPAVAKLRPEEQTPPGRGRTQGGRAGTRCFILAFGEGCQCVVPSSSQLKWL